MLASQIETKVFGICTYKNMQTMSNVYLKNDIEHLELLMKKDWDNIISWRTRVEEALKTKNQEHLIFR